MAAAAHGLPHGVVLYRAAERRRHRAGGRGRRVLRVGDGRAVRRGRPTAPILPFPSHEVDPYRGLAPHVGVTSARARALHGIGAGTARVVVASAAALMPRISAPRRLLGAALDLKPGQEIAPTDLAELLIDAGFTREDPADEHGEFAVRGGIVDIFPAGEAQPVRLEFVGDTIESMRRYDPATQRSVESIDQVSIVPLQDVLTVSVEPPEAGPRRDALRLPQPPQRQPDHRLRAGRGRRGRRQARRAAPAKLRGRAGAKGTAACAPADLLCEPGRAWRRASIKGHIWLALGLDDDAANGDATGGRIRARGASRRTRAVSARRGDAREGRRLGRRDPPPPRRRRNDAVRRGDRRPRGTNHRAPQGIRSPGGPRRSCGRCAVRRGARGDGNPVRAVSACRTPACRSTPKPTSSRKSGARPSGGARPRRRSCRISAISRSTTSSCTSITASGCSSA